VVDILELFGDRGFGLRQARLLGDILDHAPQRGCAIKRALRPLQHLDPLDVGRIEVGQKLSIFPDGRRPAYRDVVDIGGYRGADALRGDAPDLDRAITGRAEGLQIDAGNILNEVREAVGGQFIEPLVAHHGYAGADGLEVFGPLVGGDDDFLELVLAPLTRARVGILGASSGHREYRERRRTDQLDPAAACSRAAPDRSYRYRHPDPLF
jgi:hypothetical protein